MIKRRHESDNFWIAYADLMAGLLFVFILIIGAIVVKYVFTQDDLAKSKEKLAIKEKRLLQSAKELRQKEEILQGLSKRLSAIKKNKEDLEANLSSSKNIAKDLNLSVSQRDIQILALLEEISKKDKLLYEKDLSLEEVKAKIKALGFMKSKIADELKNKLGEGFSIDTSSGAISLPSSVLFDKNSYALKPEAKEHLKELLKKYFDSILNDEKILKNIENIVIEGHTDSDGSYIFNLDLSQKRAYEVMNFIYSFYKDERLQKLLIASGRSNSKLIYKNQKEDKEASRRIEIRFNISLKHAINDLESFIDDKNY